MRKLVEIIILITVILGCKSETLPSATNSAKSPSVAVSTLTPLATISAPIVTSTEPPTEPPTETQAIKTPKNEQTNNLNSPSSSTSTLTQAPELTIDDAKALLKEADKRTRVVTMYGNELNEIEVADGKNGFYFYSKELNSTENLINYLNKVFTDNVSKSLMKDMTFKIIDSRLAF